MASRDQVFRDLERRREELLNGLSRLMSRFSKYLPSIPIPGPHPPRKEIIRALEEFRKALNQTIDRLERRIAGKEKNLLPSQKAKKARKP